MKKSENKYSNKIKTVAEIKKIIGKIPRKKKVILCHGNFDVVHPGHVRHLIYAKSKASTLIVSITADQYIKKGINRPFVPENLRALNLAAFQMVDYVLIDNNQKPLKNLKKLKPDYFAKGFEYTSSGLMPATKEESDVVSSFGGEMIFTPGDIVYSSTSLLNLHQPKIDNFKLQNLMSKYSVSFEKLKKTLSKFDKLKIHVVGDLIIDTYTRTNLIGGLIKTPTPSVLYQEKDNYIGGAGIVANHLKSLGAKVTLTTVVGNDKWKNFVIQEFKKSKVKLKVIVDNTRPTTNKNTIIANDYKLLKVDTLDNHPISEKILERIQSNVKKVECDAIIFSDFRHGIFNKSSIPLIIKSIKNNIFKVADSQVATRWGNITDFKNFDLITPNEKEARFSLADQDSSISNLTRQLALKTKFKNLILKLGEKGIVSVSSNKKNSYSFSTPSFVKNPIDAVGAGDALLSVATLSFLSTKSLVVASILGSIAAACECEFDGNVVIKKSQILDKINNIKELSNYSS
jgi:rfaE bifunctional protein kinase chain/domain